MQGSLFNSVVYVVILILSVVIHEVAHGYMALWLGDTTARDSKRLSLNPIRHLDPIGSLLVPFLLIISHIPFVVGWAKPVPVNVRRLRGASGPALVAIAGPLANLMLASVVGLFMQISGGLTSPALSVLFAVVQVNCVLMIFNLVPIPPLDGFHVFRYFFGKHRALIDFFERYSLILILLVLFFFQDIAQYPIQWIVSVLSGV